MQVNHEKTVREIAIEMPGATRVFEKMGIDYCCGGAQTLTEACRIADVTVEEIARSLEQIEISSQAAIESADWKAKSLTSLINHIVDKHHSFTREEMEGIGPLLEKVRSVYGERWPNLLEVESLFTELKSELLLHMKKEENILFPYITQMETAKSKSMLAPLPMFGTVLNPVRMMMSEHDGAGDVLRKIRQLTDNFNPPADACVSYKTLYRRLEELEQDLHQHIHLENNILFPGAIEMEG